MKNPFTKMSSIKNFGIVLFIILVLSGGLLGLVTFFLYHSIIGWEAFVIVVVHLLIVAFIYFLVNFLYNAWFSYTLRKIAQEINSIDLSSVESNVEPLYLHNWESSQNVINAITNLRAQICLKEATRLQSLDIISKTASHVDLDSLLNSIMPALVDCTKSNSGAFYLVNKATSRLEIKSSIGFGKNIYKEFDVDLGEGFLGHINLADLKEVVLVNDIPDDTVFISSTFLGEIRPKSIMFVPVFNLNELIGVMVLASIHPYEKSQVELVEMVRVYLGALVSKSVIFERMKRLSNELQFQNKLIQDMNDELEEQNDKRTVFLNNIIGSVRDYAIFAMDSNGVITLWNAGAENIYGYKMQDVIGQPGEVIYGGDIEKERRFRTNLATTKKEGSYVFRDWRKNKEGAWFYADINVFAVYSGDEHFSGYTVVTKDATNLKELNDHLTISREICRQVIEDSRCAFILLNSNGGIKTISDIAKTLLGIGDEDYKDKLLSDYFFNAEAINAYLFTDFHQDKVQFGLKTGEDVYVTSSIICDEKGAPYNITVLLLPVIEDNRVNK